MPRRLIVCIDGTWNSSAEKSRVFSSPTNVSLISQLLLDDGKTQRVIYVPGVGTQGLADRAAGGMWGAGSTERVCSGNRFLCESYEAGDEIALFGFSRGAFAVRSIVGVTANLGVLRSDQLHHVSEAVSLYRRPISDPQRQERVSSFKEAHCHGGRPPILFVGVWDTVIRYGPFLAPFRYLLEKTLKEHLGLFDQRTPPHVRHFCHALALDERRSAFWPWRAENREDVADQIVEEMWFAGSHSDVGGGYLDSRLAELPLQWICQCAAAAGLMLHRVPAVAEDSYLAPLNPSRVGVWRILPSRRRVVRDSDSLHYSVQQRIRCSSYRPAARLPAGMLGRLTRA